MAPNRQHVVSPQEHVEQDSQHDEPHATDAPLNNLISPEREREDAVRAGTMIAGEAGSTHDADPREWHLDVGVDVIGACGHKLGEVVDVKDKYIVVEKGFFTPEDFFVPKSAIDHFNDHALTLNVSKDKAMHSGWDEDPESPDDAE
jgi:hypothetical protein